MMKIFSIISLLLVSSCARVQNYQGQRPDASARGQFEKFELTQDFWKQSPFFLRMEGDKKYYTLSSLRPVIEEVSPEANHKMQTARLVYWSGWVPLTASLALIIKKMGDDNEEFSGKETTLFYSLIGLSLGANFSSAYLMSEAAKIYNHDLKKKFAPSYTWNFSF